MKAENKQLNRYCNDKDAIIQALKADTPTRIDTSLDKNNNRFNALSDLHWDNIVMNHQTICEHAKELQEERKISNIVSFFLYLYLY